MGLYTYEFVVGELKARGLADIRKSLTSCSVKISEVRKWANYIKHKGGIDYKNLEAANPYQIYLTSIEEGQDITSLPKTEEHVYPKWLQRDFDLWNKELILLNGTPIKYKNLKIPCCTCCNNKMSGNIENPIKKGVSLGYDAFINIVGGNGGFSFEDIYKGDDLVLSYLRDEDGTFMNLLGQIQ